MVRNMCAENMLVDSSPAIVGETVPLEHGEGRKVTSTSSDMRKKLAQYWGKDVMWDCPLAKFSTLRVGGPAGAVVFPANKEEIGRLIVGLRQDGIPWRIIGRGSNILVPDEGFPGVVIVLGKSFSGIEAIAVKKNAMQVQVEAGCGLGRLVSWCTEQGLSGLEFAVGIPGSVGGAIVMNAGAWGKDISGVVSSVSFMNGKGELSNRNRQELRFAYRSLEKAPDEIIASAVFELHQTTRAAIEATCREYNDRRKDSQPQKVASAGSFFKNPPGHAAGRLIERAGLKGRKVGGAMVSEIHGNFLVNAGGATAQDFYELIALITATVFEQSGVRLEPEVDIWPLKGQ